MNGCRPRLCPGQIHDFGNRVKDLQLLFNFDNALVEKVLYLEILASFFPFFSSLLELWISQGRVVWI